MIPKKSNAVKNDVAAAAPANVGITITKGTQPQYVLKYKEGKDGKFQRLTGLFEKTAKNGEKFLSGTDRENGITYVIMPNTYQKQA